MLTQTLFIVAAMTAWSCLPTNSGQKNGGEFPTNIGDSNASKPTNPNERVDEDESVSGDEDELPPTIKTVKDLCQESWERHHAQTTPSPWAIAGVDSNRWTASAIVDGEQFDLRAAEFSQYEEVLDLGHGKMETVTCEVPVAWQGTASRVRVEPIDCAIRNTVQQFNLQFQAIGGIVFKTFMPGQALERRDVALAWHLRPGEMGERDKESIRQVFGLEDGALLSLASSPNLHAEAMPGIAVSFAVSERAEDAELWGILNSSTRDIPTEKPFTFLPSDPVPSLSDDLVAASKDHPSVGLQALVAWDASRREKVPCDTMHRAADRSTWCGWVLPLRAEAWRQQTIERGRSGFVHILWSNGDESVFLTTVEVSSSGDLVTRHTTPVDDVEVLGLPAVRDMLSLQWP